MFQTWNYICFFLWWLRTLMLISWPMNSHPVPTSTSWTTRRRMAMDCRLKIKLLRTLGRSSFLVLFKLYSLIGCISYVKDYVVDLKNLGWSFPQYRKMRVPWPSFLLGWKFVAGRLTMHAPCWTRALKHENSCWKNTVKSCWKNQRHIINIPILHHVNIWLWVFLFPGVVAWRTSLVVSRPNRLPSLGLSWVVGSVTVR